MAFTPKSWQNSPSTSTPLNAAALIDLETRLSSYTDSGVAAVKPSNDYTLEDSGGGTYTLYSAGGSSTNSNPAALLETAFTGLRTTGGRIYVKAGTYNPTTIAKYPANTTKWITVEFAPGATWVLNNSNAYAFMHCYSPLALTNGAAALPTGTIAYDNGDSNWNADIPNAGYVQMGWTVIQYTGRTGTTAGNLTGCTVYAGQTTTIADNTDISLANATWGKFRLINATIDASAVVNTTTSNTITKGTLIVALDKSGRYSNYDGWDFTNCTVINGFNDTSGAYAIAALQFVPQQWYQNQTNVNYVRNIHVHECEAYGMNKGFVFGGYGWDGAAGQAANVLVDYVYLEKCVHEITTAHTGGSVYTSSNFHLGMRGRVGTAAIVDCRGKNSGDVGIEINNQQNVFIKDNVIDNAYAASLTFNQYNPPTDLDSSVTVVDGLRMTASAVGAPSTRYVGVVLGTGGTPNHGHFVFQNCEFVRTSTDWPGGITGLAFSSSSSNTFKSIVIDNLYCYVSGFTYTSTSNATPTCLRFSGTGNRLVLRNINTKVVGTRNNTGNFPIRGVTFAGGAINHLDIDGMYYEASITNTGAASSMSLSFAIVDLSDNTGQTFNTISIRNVVSGTIAGDTSPRGIIVRGTGVMTLNGKCVIENCDLTTLVNNSNTTMSPAIHPDDGTNTEKLTVRNIKFASALTVNTLTAGASPYTYQNTRGFPMRVILDGGTVSKLEWSNDNTNWYDVGPTQSIDLGTGEYMKITYSSAPTITRIPRV